MEAAKVFPLVIGKRFRHFVYHIAKSIEINFQPDQ